MAAQRIKKSVISGSWYPGDPHVLRDAIEQFFSSVPDRGMGKDIIGLVSPHAGYVYSGQIAAYAYGQIRGKRFDTVIVIGPSHRKHFSGVSIYASGGYETPLGIVPVDEKLAGDILGSGAAVSDIPEAHAQEHSLEIQLPFLQVALGRFTFVPLVMGEQNRSTCEEIAEAIVYAVGNRRVLLVASSDLSHYHPYGTAVEMDRRALDDIVKMDAVGLLRALEMGECEACGGGPVAATIIAAKKLGAVNADILKYANSGDVTGDRSAVVGYAAVLFCGKGGGEPPRSG